MVVLSAIGVAALLSGCSLAQRPGAPDSKAAAATELKTDVEQLRADNDELRQQQTQLQQKVSEMDKAMLQRAQEQRRFQEMMATNFDMLEQSVSMTLSKHADAATAPGKPATPAAASVPTRLYNPPAPAASAAAAPHENAAAVSRESASPAPGTGSVRASAPRPVAMNSPATEGGSAFREDQDLQPPAQAVKLEAHPAAKPLYDKGFAAFARRDYDTAVQIFNNFLEKYPTDIYSDNAQFWIAEAYFYQNRLDEAENAYRLVLRNYEHRSTLEGYKTPDAIYRLGQTYLKRRNSERAAYYFANVAERFSESSAGIKAHKEMATIVSDTAQANR
ncbi:MAG: tetratricopeptide repeat protein [Candidatus Lambdaproteobacteria bacterium]|nr:tetratricopeptide repeat protein [Candidatus Lambdaproteobacteria bacterium]